MERNNSVVRDTKEKEESNPFEEKSTDQVNLSKGVLSITGEHCTRQNGRMMARDEEPGASMKPFPSSLPVHVTRPHRFPLEGRL